MLAARGMGLRTHSASVCSIFGLIELALQDEMAPTMPVLPVGSTWA
jgi:hypothetical protein